MRPGVEPAWGRAVQGVAAGLQQPRVLPPPEPRVPGMLDPKLPQLTVKKTPSNLLHPFNGWLTPGGTLGSRAGMLMGRDQLGSCVL